MDKALIKAAIEYGTKRWQTESWDNKMSQSDFQAEEVGRLVDEYLKSHWILSEKDSKAFWDAISSAPEPNHALRKLMGKTDT